MALPQIEIRLVDALAIHAYAGGMSRGIMDAGFKVVHQLEAGKFGVECAEKNLGVKTTIGVEDWNLKRFKGCSCVFGNPPCSAYSQTTAGLHGPWMEERRSHAYSMLDALKIVRPKVWILESVPGIEKAGRDVTARIEETAKNLGYAVTYWRHDIKFLGAAQGRTRVYVICHKVHIDFPLLGRSLWNTDFRLRTCSEALSEIKNPGFIPPITDKYIKSYELTPPGGKPRNVYLEKFLDDEDQAAPSFLVVRLHPDRPSCTLMGNPKFYVHPTEIRLLGIKEAAHLCGYPKKWNWVAKSNQKNWDYMCKASLPPAGKAIGERVMDAIESNKKPHYKVAIMNQWSKGVGANSDHCRNAMAVME